MKLAAKQLLALGVPPDEIIRLDEQALERGLELRQLVQRILHAWLQSSEKEAAAELA